MVVGDDAVAFGGRERGGEVSVEDMQALDVAGGVGGVTGGVLRIGFLEGGEDVRDGVRGKRGVEPEVRVGAVVVMMAVLAGEVDVRELSDEAVFRHAGEGLDDGGGPGAFRGLHRLGEPVLHAEAVDDEELRAGELAEVARGELVVVRASVGGEKIFNLSEVAGDVRGETIDGEEAGEDAELGGRFGGAGASGEAEERNE